MTPPDGTTESGRKVRGGEEEEEEPVMVELSRMVKTMMKESSWWERRGLDWSILAVAFLCLPVAFLLLRSAHVLVFTCGLLLMGVAHATISFKGNHLASHGALSESPAWTEVWAVFFIEVCGAFSAQAGVHAHIKRHHAHTNIIGLGDSSAWKVARLPRLVYLFVAPLALPLLTPLVAVAHLRGRPPLLAARTLLMILLGLHAHYWLLLHLSGFRTPLSAALCMLASRAMFSVPFIHVNIFQHIGLPMFSQDRRPKRHILMTHGVMNLPRNFLLDWTFGHSLVSCHLEHHLFPHLSDNMCLKVKPVVSRYLSAKNLPYQQDGYVSRLKLFFHKYQELMVEAPPITELVGVQ
ncbi:fatty acid desaturase 6 [Nerophis lumbriciformis]|uniref:fatty acid desaturase 6 n=1 Tax=Nerophis lumbriciformis TaxID=546530 RepID=UPI002AE09F9B|nr:fatty acid desaturase 6 [Nerophis lumbriciformis]